MGWIEVRRGGCGVAEEGVEVWTRWRDERKGCRGGCGGAEVSLGGVVDGVEGYRGGCAGGEE